MKKVLLVSCEGLGNGGVQNVIMNIVRNLKDKYIFDILLFTDEVRFYDKEFESYGGKIYRIAKYNGKNKIKKYVNYYTSENKIYRYVRSILKNDGPYCAVHCNNEFESAIILKVAYKCNIPIRISHAHVNHEKNLIKDILKLRLIKKILIDKYANEKIGCSKEAIKSLYLRPYLANIVENPYDNKKFYYSKKSNNTNLVLTQIGSFNNNKNQLFSLQILKELTNMDINTKLNLIGFGSDYYKKKIDDFIVNNNLKNNVCIFPSDADTQKILSESFALLLPSVREGFGIVAIEAQATGCRCFVSNTVPQSINCGGCTFLSLESGAKFWANSIWKEFKKNGKNRIQYFEVARFQTYNVAKKFDNIYSQAD